MASPSGTVSSTGVAVTSRSPISTGTGLLYVAVVDAEGADSGFESRLPV
jgi:hypothetical protein